MFPKQRIAWVEGMLMEPQHFQQQERYFEHIIDARINGTHAYNWGFNELEIDEGFLQQGTLALRKASGIFPDGTPFNFPTDGPPPAPLRITEEDIGKYVCLTILMDIPGNEYIPLATTHYHSRYRTIDADIADRNSGIVSEGTPNSVTLQLGQLSYRLQIREHISSAESSLVVALISDRQRDKRIKLDESILPPMLDYRAIGWLQEAVKELVGLMAQRLEAVFQFDLSRTVGGLSELIELLLLQSLSEYHLTLSHLLSHKQIHPERLYVALIGLLGRLSIIPDGERIWNREDLRYLHEEPHRCYFPLITSIRRALSLVIEAPAVALPFKDRGDNIYLCQNDAQLRLEKIVFAISCALPADLLRGYFPAQTKLGPVEKISQFVDLQLPGARLLPMTAPPRHIPYYPNSIYFEVDTSDAVYQEMMSGAAMALSIVGDFPELRFDVWGLRQGRIG